MKIEESTSMIIEIDILSSRLVIDKTKSISFVNIDLF